MGLQPQKDQGRLRLCDHEKLSNTVSTKLKNNENEIYLSFSDSFCEVKFNKIFSNFPGKTVGYG
jgi:hypothetical protein